ncbi:MAG TPA: c-type cytochrome [Nannocystis exedens]|nr:c-type cytochrome [Nannocystis exedens]
MLSRALAVTLAVISCGGAPAIDPAIEAQSVWQTRCVNCHGSRGRGDGPAGRATSPPPRDFSDPNWQRNDGQIRLAILYGGAAAGLNPAMAPNPDLRDKPAVVEALVAIVRSFGAAQVDPVDLNGLN